MIRKIWLAIVMVGGLVALDIYTKNWALNVLHHGFTIEGVGGIPLTLAFNKGIAFGLPLPGAGRWIIIIATIVVLYVLSGMFMKADERDWGRLMPVQLVSAGAIGNLIDRVRWDRGVVDFIGPVDLGVMQWPIFNVADMAITTGALFLALSLLREDAALAVAEKQRALEMDGTVN